MADDIREATIKFVAKYGQTMIVEQIIPHCDNKLVVELTAGILVCDASRWILSLPKSPPKKEEVLIRKKSLWSKYKGLLSKVWGIK